MVPFSELLFTLMQFMCRGLYRDPKASFCILKHLINMLDTIWTSESTMKQNCLIMIKSYVQRCEKQHYPPNVAGLIYECVANIAMLNRKYNFGTEDTFENALLGKIKGDVHNLRLYCCYLLKLFIGQFSEDKADFFLAELLEIFVIKVSEEQDHALKDEFANRTSTVLHCFLALAQTRQPHIQKIVTSILQIQKDKSLDKCLVKKVLKKIVTVTGVKDFDNYVDQNVVSVLYFWFLKDNSLYELPVDLLGFDSLDLFSQKHNKWLISADILWNKDGDINSCDLLKKSSRSPGQIIEVETIILLLVYVL